MPRFIRSLFQLLAGVRRTLLPRSSVAEYWIGKDVDYAGIWAAYEAGVGYEKKFFSEPEYLLVIEFATPWAPQSPLFDHEAVFKTLKGLFHDLKKLNLSTDEYARAGPMYLYSVERGSSIYKFLGGLRELLMHGLTLDDVKIMKAHQQDIQTRVEFIKKNFREVDDEAARKYLMARTTYEMDEALEKLMRKGIKSIKISTEPVSGEVELRDIKMIELKTSPKADKEDAK